MGGGHNKPTCTTFSPFSKIYSEVAWEEEAAGNEEEAAMRLLMIPVKILRSNTTYSSTRQ